MSKWLTSKEFRKKYQISSATLWRRVHHNKVKTKDVYGTVYYLDEDEPEGQTMNVIYCRVSNTKQQDDLKRQEQILREYCVSNGIIPDRVISDIASGMNEDRKGLQELISLVKDGKVKTVYVSYKDRLTRFGFGYFKYLFSLFGTEICVVNLTIEEDYLEENISDLSNTIEYFSKIIPNDRMIKIKVLKTDIENEISEISKNNLNK